MADQTIVVMGSWCQICRTYQDQIAIPKVPGLAKLVRGVPLDAPIEGIQQQCKDCGHRYELMVALEKKERDGEEYTAAYRLVQTETGEPI